MQTPDSNYKSLFRNFLLFIIVAFAFVWTKTELGAYTPLLVAATVILYFLVHLGLKKKLETHQTQLDVYFACFVVFLIVFYTGGLASPVFFLIYFLLFGTSLLLSTTSTNLIVIVASILFFTSLSGNPIRELLSIASLFFIAPIANITGRQYFKNQQDEQRIKYLQEVANQMENDLNTVKNKNESKSKVIKGLTNMLVAEQVAAIWKQLYAILEEEDISPKESMHLEEVSKALRKIKIGADKIQENNQG